MFLTQKNKIPYSRYVRVSLSSAIKAVMITSPFRLLNIVLAGQALGIKEEHQYCLA